MSVDRKQLQLLIRDLGQVPAAVRKQMRPAMLKAGQPVLDQMRADSSWSTRIPGAISMRQSSGGVVGLTFRVNSGRAPHARPYEHDGNPGTFRAPLWGDREHWFPHEARPFFYKAVVQRADQVVEKLGDAIDQAARETGFA